MDSNLKLFFYFTKNERISILIICMVSFSLLIIPKFLQKSQFIGSSKNDKHEADYYNKISEKLVYKSYNVKKDEKAFSASEYKFSGLIDINSASLKQLLDIGLSKKTAHIIVKYIDKGGQFYNQESFKKIYGISDKELKILSQTTVFPESEKTEGKLNPVVFDPNTTSKEDFVRMGLPLRVAQTISNFREKGGKFYAREDLAKVYGMKSEWFNELLPYVIIQLKEKPGISFDGVRSFDSKPKPKIQLININTASVEDLDKIKGVGPAIASKIVKFRDYLGGFATKDQIAETRGLPDSTFQAISSAIVVNNDYNKLKINYLDKFSLSKHAYINSTQALILTNYRLQHGPFNDLSDVQKSKAFSDSEIKKLLPYLDFSK
jgi:competence protein ComEA